MLLDILSSLEISSTVNQSDTENLRAVSSVSKNRLIWVSISLHTEQLSLTGFLEFNLFGSFWSIMRTITPVQTNINFYIVFLDQPAKYNTFNIHTDFHLLNKAARLNLATVSAIIPIARIALCEYILLLTKLTVLRTHPANQSTSWVAIESIVISQCFCHR